MGLFQKSVLIAYLNSLNKETVTQAYTKYKNNFFDPAKQVNIQNAKEEQYQEGFLRELFVDVLDYTLNPSPDYNLLTEYKNEKDSKKADGAVLKDGVTIAVIELKGTDTVDLDHVETQAFGYKNNHKGCLYVITSNFEKLRFYIEDAVEHLEFDLFTLSEEEFKLLYLCLQKDNLLNNLPFAIKEASINEEKDISKKFYNDYSNFKRKLYQNIYALNPVFDKLVVYKKTQKLLDRFLFILFAEDKQLLPPNSIREILNQWLKLKDLDEPVPLYNRYRKYFGYMNSGYKGKLHDIFAYNGGLFTPDDVLDNIQIDDTLLYDSTYALSHYDFETDIDVNILGHIFEHSLNDIDTISAEVEGQEVEVEKTRRKKEGIFYTPKYITKYIVDNTVGKLCEEKKVMLEIKDEDYAAGKKKKDKKALNAKLEKYRQWLLAITILDPACGSGAFLNQALEFLITEHRKIDELRAKLFGDTFVLTDVDNLVLENNLYGVDLNEESIEIAKLSLWLRTAKKGRKLSSLNNNIKCGNSLIDDPVVAGDKAFNWKEQFAAVFAKGGFDVVIGNPPYVGEKGHSDIFETLRKIPKWKDYYRRRSNTYYFFIKQGIDLLKDCGIQSLIVPREFTTADWANKVRKEILDKTKIIEIADFNDLKVFDDAGTTSLVITHSKSAATQPKYTFNLKSLRVQKSISKDLFEKANDKLIDIREFDSSGAKIWSFYQNAIPLKKSIISLITLFDISQGLVTGADKIGNKHVVAGLADEKIVGRGIFILKEGVDIDSSSHLMKLKIENEWITLSEEDKTFIKPYIKTEGLNKWQVIESDLKVIYIGNRDLTENIKKYLMQFSSILINRSTTVPEGEIITFNEFENFTLKDIKEKYSLAGAVQKVMKRKKWYLPLYERTNIPFPGPKMIVNTKNMDKFTYSENEHYSGGGGAGGQNYIYPILEKDRIFYDELLKESDLASFVKFTNAILNSEKIQTFIASGQFNQLSTEKIGDLPIIRPSFKIEEEKKVYDSIVANTNFLISSYELRYKICNNFIKLLSNSFTIAENFLFDNWPTLGFGDFIKQLNQAIKREGGQSLTKASEMEWLEVFENQKTKATVNEADINRVEKEIDQMVYKLFDLTE